MAVKKLKKCPNCQSLETKRSGKFRDIQRYKCLACCVQFSSKRRPKKLEQVIFNTYFYHKSIPWVRNKIFEYEPALNTYNPRDVLVVADASFFGIGKL